MAKKKPIDDMDEIGSMLDEMGNAIMAKIPPGSAYVTFVIVPGGDAVSSSNIEPAGIANALRSIADDFDRALKGRSPKPSYPKHHN